ncbi:MAG: glucose 1-dehydrogenase [Actinobacteria bacterium]|nr:glucose 1-dehydrogenase [Actinomycetota bacterium]
MNGVRLEGKVAVITGSGRGQGREAALLFSREGAKVAVFDIDGSLAGETSRLVTKEGGESFCLTGDVSNPEDVRRLMDGAAERFGQIDILYNNAGVFLPDLDDEVVNAPLDVVDRILDVNLKGVFYCCKYGIPHLLAGDGGSIINTASGLGLKGGSVAPAYSASKGGVIALTRNIAVTYGRQGIRANAICPALVNTPMIDYYFRFATRQELGTAYPLGRIGEPIDTALLALYLASDESSWVTGAIIPIDGGHLA